MSAPVIAQPAPAFELPATGDQTLSLAGFEGRNLILYFYPKDSTPGCTQEGKDFSEHYAKFQALDTDILGVSRDGLKAHENFKAKQGFPFDLLSDKDETLCKAYDVLKVKKLYGREGIGVERSTFLINGDGILCRVWRKVKVKGHVDEVLAAAAELPREQGAYAHIG